MNLSTPLNAIPTCSQNLYSPFGEIKSKPGSREVADEVKIAAGKV